MIMAAAAPQDSTQDSTMRNDALARDGKGEASAPVQSTSRHDEFYFTDEMTVFQVENRLFRVHRHFLAENSLVFSSMFSLPRETGEAAAVAVEGASDANPIYLSGVTELEFETLLRYFYKSMHDGFSLPQTSWIALLSIAHRYEFLNVRERAIREIYPISLLHPGSSLPSLAHLHLRQDHVLLISVGEKYDVPLRYMLLSLVALVWRGEPLSVDEVALFSALTVSRLAHAREDYARRTVNLPPEHVGWTNKPTEHLTWSYGVARNLVCMIWAIPNDN